jgi:outer membrane protein assembly factor BamB
MIRKALLLCLLLTPAASAQDWPHWRGPDSNGVSPETGWQAQGAEQDLWRLDVGLGYASPAIVGDVLYVQGYRPELKSDVLQAVNVESGEQLWRHTYPAKLRDIDHGGGSLTSPTLDGELLFVTCREGGVRCYMAATGELLWYKNIARLYKTDENPYGYSSSPVVVDELLLFNMDKVVALDKFTGDTLWLSESLEAFFSTPSVMEYRGEPALAVFSQHALHVIDMGSGEERAKMPWRKSARLVNASTPIVMGERVFISSAYDNGCCLIDFSTDEPEFLWRSRRLRTKMAGCVIIGDYVYGFDESMLMCLSMADGKLLWRKRGLGNGALIAGDGKLVILSSKGELIVAEATHEGYRELSNTRVIADGGVFWSPPVIAGGRIFCRNDLGTLVARDHRMVRTGAMLAKPETGAGQALPPAAALFEKHLAAIGGADVVNSHSSMLLEGTFEMPAVGFTPVALSVRRALPNRWSMAFAAPGGRSGQIERRFDGEVVFELNPFLGDTLFGQSLAGEMSDMQLLHGDTQFASMYSKLETVGRTEFDDRDCFQVRATSKTGAVRNLYFEVQSGLLAGHSAEHERMLIFSDYKSFDGLMLPTLERCFMVDTGIEETSRITKVSFESVEDAHFVRPSEIDELIEERAAAGE